MSGYIEDAFERKGTIPGNHQDITKFSNSASGGYQRVYHTISDFVEQARQAVDERRLLKPSNTQS